MREHDHLNFFEPYEHIPVYHENQLTRALLVVLRYSPMAHQVFLSLIDPAKKLYELPRPTFATQKVEILADKPKDSDALISCISVICVADATESAAIAMESNRGQILDGIVRYGDDLVVIIESKLGGHVDDRQAREINVHGQSVRLDEKVRAVSWRTILSAFDDLANDQRAITNGAERAILEDFLEFVDRHFSRLGPYSSLGRCKKEPSRVMRRLKMVCEEATGGEPFGHGAILPDQRLVVASVYLNYEQESKPEIRLHMYPADTLDQARALYARPGAPERLLALESKGWRIVPNFHFGFMAKGLSWTHAMASVDDYVSYWQANIRKARQINRAEWEDYWKQLIALGFAQEADREKFDSDFTQTSRTFASPRPGLECRFIWRLAKAEQLDSKGKFVGEVKMQINELLAAVEEPILT